MKRLAKHINYIWRVIATRVCFGIFGLGALILSFILLPLIRLLSLDPQQKELRAQYSVSLTFKLFVFIMQKTGVINFNFENFEQLKNDKGCLLISNHPTLIDYVTIVSKLKHCYTIVKEKVRTNLLMHNIVHATGYISNAESEQTLQHVATKFANGNNLLIFPEGTRTTPNQALSLQRGAANIAIRTKTPIRIIRIKCQPAFLTKQCKWYRIPKQKVELSIRVGERIDIKPFIGKNTPPSLAARQLTRLLTDKLQQEAIA